MTLISSLKCWKYPKTHLSNAEKNHLKHEKGRHHGSVMSHSLWTLVCALNAPLLIQLSARGLGSVWASVIRRGTWKKLLTLA